VKSIIHTPGQCLMVQNGTRRRPLLVPEGTDPARETAAAMLRELLGNDDKAERLAGPFVRNWLINKSYSVRWEVTQADAAVFCHAWSGREAKEEGGVIIALDKSLDLLQMEHDAAVEESCRIRTQEQYRRAMGRRHAAFDQLLMQAYRQFPEIVSTVEDQA